MTSTNFLKNTWFYLFKHQALTACVFSRLHNIWNFSYPYCDMGWLDWIFGLGSKAFEFFLGYHFSFFPYCTCLSLIILSLYLLHCSVILCLHVFTRSYGNKNFTFIYHLPKLFLFLWCPIDNGLTDHILPHFGSHEYLLLAEIGNVITVMRHLML